MPYTNTKWNDVTRKAKFSSISWRHLVQPNSIDVVARAWNCELNRIFKHSKVPIACGKVYQGRVEYCFIQTKFLHNHFSYVRYAFHRNKGNVAGVYISCRNSMRDCKLLYDVTFICHRWIIWYFNSLSKFEIGKNRMNDV